MLMRKSARPLTDQILLPTFVLSVVARSLELESSPFLSIDLRSLKTDQRRRWFCRRKPFDA